MTFSFTYLDRLFIICIYYGLGLIYNAGKIKSCCLCLFYQVENIIIYFIDIDIIPCLITNESNINKRGFKEYGKSSSYRPSTFFIGEIMDVLIFV